VKTCRLFYAIAIRIKFVSGRYSSYAEEAARKANPYGPATNTLLKIAGQGLGIHGAWGVDFLTGGLNSAYHSGQAPDPESLAKTASGATGSVIGTRVVAGAINLRLGTQVGLLTLRGLVGTGIAIGTGTAAGLAG
jgi:hypothetical protein